MHEYETNDQWATGDAAVQSPPTGGEQGTNETQVLARIPDLDAPASSGGAKTGSTRSHGRILSPSMSMKLLAGGAVLLILAAVIPYAMNREKPPTDRHPAPDADPAPAFVGGSAQAAKGQTPTTPPTTPVLRPAPPNLSFNAEIPAGPDFTNPARKSGNIGHPTPPSQDPATKATPQSGAAGGTSQPRQGSFRVENPYAVPKPQPAAANQPMQVPRISSRPQESRFDGGGQLPAAGSEGVSSPWPRRQQQSPPPFPANPTSPPAFQQPATANTYTPPSGFPGNRDYPSGALRQQGTAGGYPARPQQVYPANPQHGYSVNPQQGYPANPQQAYGDNPQQPYRANSWDSYRREYQANPRPSNQPPQTYPTNPQTDPRYGSAPATSQWTQPVDPGVARFQNTIVKPPLR